MVKTLTVGPVDAPARTTPEQAFEAVFGPETLHVVHGPSVRVSPWDDAGRRTVRFGIDVHAVPAEIRRFFCGNHLRVTTRQQLRKAPDQWTVKNSMKMHFLGAELFKVSPQFVLAIGSDGAVRFTGTVKHRALLPPPLKGLAEGVMAEHSRRELERYAVAARAAMARARTVPIVPVSVAEV